MVRENFSDLIAFLTVARECSFTRAAAQLGLSQSAVSHTIKELEARLGIRLLTRTTRSVSPTEAGERLLRSLSPSYFASRPKPLVPEDLTDHSCINIRFPTHGGLYAWEFEKDGRELNVRVEGTLTFNMIGLRLEAVLAGYGLGFMIRDQVDSTSDTDA